jgi:membrane protease YdiL (CAAX protease family)
MMQPFRKPSLRGVVALLAFFGMSYIASHFESLLLDPILAFVRNDLHLSFKTVYGPRPAVTVNLFAAITIERSLSILIVTWIALKIAQQPWSKAGFVRRGALRLYGSGLCTGFLSITFLILAMWAAGGLISDGIVLTGGERLTYPLRWAIGMMLGGFEEECGLRGFSLFAIEGIVGAWPAAVVSAGIFVLGHIGNPGENALGLLQVFAFGLFCSLNVLRTRSIWWATAFHGAWNWTQESFYGAIGSGYWFDAHLFQFRPRGRELISGGTAGPEGSLFVFVILAALIAYESVRLRSNGGGARASFPNPHL